MPFFDTDTVSEGARNLWALTFGDGVSPQRRTEHTVLVDDPHRTLRRYGDPAGPPVLLVPPIAAPATCYDLSDEFSLVEHFRETGRTPYVVDFGEIGYADRGMGFEDFILDIIPEAIERVLADAGAERVDLVAWSLGGTLSLLTAAVAGKRGDSSIRSVTAIATPLDYDALFGYKQLRGLMRPTAGKAPLIPLRLLGGIPAPVVQIAYRSTSLRRELRKPLFILQNLRNTDTLRRMEVINRFQRTFPGYPGKLTEQMWEQFIYRNRLRTGEVTFGELGVDLADICVPVQLFGSHRDALCSWPAARHGFDVLTGAPRIEFETVESSHLGLLAGPDAVVHTWPVIDAFLNSVEGETAADLAKIDA
ncbi:alpha/beta hydrolase [Gordonia sp. TBRC 11910]|uniref:Alpha/beta hydrolase n=1 Tax=Gordonia asplenii TaxID=2725283 RepID=A0A848L0E4_9ACTN|nr:alpha/beta fold hydrolase [Gordonia asplenii]NMO04159.1 alpha/beta hydrolase [Gordonia asplenii]